MRSSGDKKGEVFRSYTDKTKVRIVEKLRDFPRGLSQLEVMTQVFGYRSAHNRLLLFSVLERQIKQDPKLTSAQKKKQVRDLLQRVVEQATEQHQLFEATRKKNRKPIRSKAEKQAASKKRQERFQELDLQELESSAQEVTTTLEDPLTASGRVRTSALSPLEGIWSTTRLATPAELVEKADPTRWLRKILRPFTVLDNPAFKTADFARSAAFQGGRSTRTTYISDEVFEALQGWESDLSRQLKQYQAVIWTRLPIEVEARKDQTFMDRVLKQRKQVDRALVQLVAQGVLELERREGINHYILRETA